MKKSLILLPVFLLLLLPGNTKALDYLGTLKEQVPEFNDYTYHTFYAHNDAYFSIILSNETPYIYSPTDTRFFHKNLKCYLFDKNTLQKSPSNCSYTSNYTYTNGKYELIIQHDYDLKYYSNNEIIKKSNYSSVEEPEPSPSPSPTPPEEHINSIFYDFSQKMLSDMPKEFSWLRIVFEYLLLFLLLIIFVGPIILLSKLLRGGN